MTWYYIGRLDGRMPKLDIEKLVIDETSKMTEEDYASEAKRCGDSLAQEGQKVTKIGQDLIERETRRPGRQSIPAN